MMLWRLANLLLASTLSLAGASLSQTTTHLSVESAASPYPQFASARWVTIQGAKGRKFLTAIFRPSGVGPFPAVVVLHGAAGLMDYYLSVAEDLARSGFVAVIGCYQAGTAQTIGTELCADATPEAEWISDPASNCGKDLISFAGALEGVDSKRIGIYGMSRGGHAALWAASTGASVQAVVVDAPAHAPLIAGPSAKTLVVLDGLSAPLLMMHGTADRVIPADQSREYENAAKARGKPITVEYYEGAGHMVSIVGETRQKARASAIDFLRANLAK